MIRSSLAHLCAIEGTLAQLGRRHASLWVQRGVSLLGGTPVVAEASQQLPLAAIICSNSTVTTWRQHHRPIASTARPFRTHSTLCNPQKPSRTRWSWLGFAAAAVCATAAGGWLAQGDSRSSQQIQQQQQHTASSSSLSGSSGLAGTHHQATTSVQQHGGAVSDGGSAGSTSNSSGPVSDIMSSVGDWYNKAAMWLVGILQQSSDEHVVIKLLALSVALLPVIVASGVLYNRASGIPLSQALYKMYCLLYRVEAGQEPNAASYLVTNAVFMLGFFTLALLLGVVNDEVQRRADDARMGRNPVHCKDHVLLLNWNTNSPALLQNIATAVAAARTKPASSTSTGHGPSVWSKDPTVVVLADMDKTQMDAAVQDAVRDRGLQLTVHTRQGNPFKLSHLKKVSAPQASVVILLHPDTDGSASDAEAMKAAAAMSFTTLIAGQAATAKHKHKHHGHHKQQRMIVQMPSSVPAGGNVLRSLLLQSSAGHQGGSSSDLDLQVLAMPDDALVNRMVAQTAAQPGVLTCWQDVLSTSAGTSQLSCIPLPQQLQHQPFINIRRSFPEAIVCGFTGRDGSIHLNPDESAVPESGSSLILLSKYGASTAPSGASPTVYEAAAQAAAHRLKGGSTYKAKASSIIVAGWPAEDIAELMRSFSDFTPPESTVTFVTQQQIYKATSIKQGNCSFKFITHPYPTSIEALWSAGIQSADCVVLGGGSADTMDAEADARVLAGLLQVQEAVLNSGSSHAPHVVAPIRSSSSSAMAIQYLQDLAHRLSNRPSRRQREATASAGEYAGRVVQPEFLVFRDVTSAVLAQVVSEHAYADIITHLLFSGEGQEMYLRSPAQFNIPTGTSITFAEVAELARQTHQTALGCIYAAPASGDNSFSRQNSGQLSAGSTGTKALSSASAVQLGLSASDTVTFNEGDRIVVLAVDFVV